MALRVTPEKVRAWQQRSRRRLNPISAKRRREKSDRDRVREAVFARDKGCRLYGQGVGPCMGEPTFHHIKKASAGGEYSVDNGAQLCSYHNGAIESNTNVAARARELGLVKYPWEH